MALRIATYPPRLLSQGFYAVRTNGHEWAVCGASRLAKTLPTFCGRSPICGTFHACLGRVGCLVFGWVAVCAGVGTLLLPVWLVCPYYVPCPVCASVMGGTGMCVRGFLRERRRCEGVRAGPPALVLVGVLG